MASTQPQPSIRDFVHDAVRLSDPTLDYQAKSSITTNIRDAIDTYGMSDLGAFITSLLPTVVSIIKTSSPSFVRDAPEQLFRHLLLETLHRMPAHELSRPMAPDLMALMIHLIRVDNEENVILAIKIAVDIYRQYKSPEGHKGALDAHAQSFIEVIHDIYKNMPELVRTSFSQNEPGALKQIDSSNPLVPGMQSFKVMAECPIATIVFGQNNTMQLITPVINFLHVQAEPQKHAHDEANTIGSLQIGMSPNVQNKTAYLSFVIAQVKSTSLLAYVMRTPGPITPGPVDVIRQHQDTLAQLLVRLLQDIPCDAAGVRKEMVVAIRHVVSTDFRSVFFPYIDRLLDERLLVGMGVTGQEQLRAVAYSTLADLVHHVRHEISAAQLTRVIHLYSCHLHHPTLSSGIQNMCSKLLVALVECVVAKCPQPESGRILMELLDCFVQKLGAIHEMFQDWRAMMQVANKDKQQKTPAEEEPETGLPDLATIEKAKPIQRATFVAESSQEVLKETRNLFRTLLHGIRGAIATLRNIDGPVPDGEVIGRMFEGGFRCLSLWEGRADNPEEKEVIEWFGAIFTDIQAHVFQEVWTTKMDFFITIAVDHPNALAVPQSLMAMNDLSRQLTSIMLKHLVDRLDELGNQDKKTALVTIRLFKMAFMAVNLLPEANEAVLAPHLSRLIMDSFPLAAKSTEPMNYYLLIRALFRSISGGKFDRVYQEILPLLQDLLEKLNRLISHAEGPVRDLLVELCLTVPVRLTHLLPYLQHLMRPLVLALQGSPEMAAQGLRTLELCIDNLTQDFLEPCFQPVHRELMGALHDSLRPLPANHVLSHAVIRILGKLGGRNRRLQYEHPVLEHHPAADEASLLLSFDGRSQKVNLGPIASLAAKQVRNTNAAYRSAAFEVLKHVVYVFLQGGAHGREREVIFSSTVEGLFNSIHMADLKEQAIQYLCQLARFVFISELTNKEPAPLSSRRYPMSPVATLFIDYIPKCLACADPQEQEVAERVVCLIVEDLVNIGKEDVSMEPDAREPAGILHNLASCFVAMCHEEAWKRKIAGCKGIIIMTAMEGLPPKFTLEREFDYVRALISILKDMPLDPPQDVDSVINALTSVIKKSDSDPPNEEGVSLHRTRMPYLVNILHVELSSSNATVRNATQKCIQLLSELSGESPTQLLLPHRERLLMPIYTKPLRALSFSTQIGHIDAVTYCLGLQPPLPEANDELLRLLSEALALADADDQNLLGRALHRQNTLALTKLRVACIKLLTASMPVTDFFSRQMAVRQRATSVYFKSLYSSSPDVKQAAHDGLRVVLQHQTRLPKELLQTGLRPILMNLADAKRISVSGLEGLARLLELLTNYFKVEIGVKLLEHFATIADASMLHEAAYTPVASNEEIMKLVKLVNIFHLLPAAANAYMENLTQLIVDTESQLMAASPSPLTEPFAKYVNRYSAESVALFFRKLSFPSFVRTYRNVLECGSAPAFREELMNKLPSVLPSLLEDPTSQTSASILLICQDLTKSRPGWLMEHASVYNSLLTFWRSQFSTVIVAGSEPPMVSSKPSSVLLSTFLSYLEHGVEGPTQIDLLFDIVMIYAVRIPVDLSALSRFLFEKVAGMKSVSSKRAIVMRFLQKFEDPAVQWAMKSQFLRMVINPMLLVALQKKDENEGMIDGEIMAKVHHHIWRTPANASAADVFPGADDALKVQLLHMSSTLVQLAASFMHESRKDLIKYGWLFIPASDMFVRQMAHVVTARFFEHFDAPSKFVLRVWTGLLRPAKEFEKNVEDRTLPRAALDILAPILSKRLPADLWVPQTRYVLHEEGHTVSALVHIYQLVVAHPDVFYECRDFLVPHMAISLSKIGLNTSAANHDSRFLSLDIIDLVLAWERRNNKDGDAMDTSPDGVSSSQTWVAPLSLRENIVSYLLRFIMTVGPAPEIPSTVRSLLLNRAIAILETVLGSPGWTEVTVKVSFFVKLFNPKDLSEGSPSVVFNAKALNLAVKDKDDAYFLANVTVLQQLIETVPVSNDSAFHLAMQPVLTRFLTAMPLPVEGDNSASPSRPLYTFLENAIHEGLRTNNNLSAACTMLQSLVRVHPKRVEPFAQGLMKVLAKLAKDHCVAPPAPNSEQMAAMIKTIFEICRDEVPLLAEQRKYLLTSFILLVERSPSTMLCRYLLEVTRDWTLVRKDVILPNLKEKASILIRMATYVRDEALYSEYLELVYNIFTEPSLRRSELTIRLEQVYLHGCRAKDPQLRDRFLDLFDESLPRGLASRLQFVLGSSNWELMPDHYWIPQALDLLLGSVNGEEPLAPSFEPGIQQTSVFSQKALGAKIHHFLKPMRTLLPLDSNTAHQTWTSVFKAIWSTLIRKEQLDVTRSLISLLSKDYHIRQIDHRVNAIQTLLTSINACSPPISLPPYLVKYLGKTFNAWHIAIEILQASLESYREEESSREGTYDALAELYAELSEEDMFYGLWRRRCLFPETNIAISFEQHGLYQQAQIIYEAAQIKARTGAIAFNESEYCVWEDHWILGAQKLQQWDILLEFARQEENHDLLLECMWRTSDWMAERENVERILSSVADVVTPRRRVFEAYTALLRSHVNGADRAEFVRILDEAMQLSLRKWAALPPIVSTSHIPLLQHFQQFVELHETSAIFNALQGTNPGNLEKRSQDLKGVLTAWRDRLPNLWDDISIWSDLVAWRQHVFSAINSAYLPLIPQQANASTSSANNNTFGYRGYHETAWIINRFAHVARKHHLQDVCHTSLAKIYTLPNIEISEAFLKLREQARCHYQNANELHAGLEVINNTNLMYFSNSQKAEFYTLKGMFIAKLNHNEEANAAFGQAVQMDLGLPKAWAEWGRYNDRLFKDAPQDISLASNAVSCYLQAAGLYKSAKTRPLLIRILWLLSNDDANLTVARAFDQYKGDLALWYWITVIPQLLQNVSSKDAAYARNMLVNLAKNHPQALFFHLRTLKEELAPSKKKYLQTMAAANATTSNGDMHNNDVAGATPGQGMAIDPSQSNSQSAQMPNGQRPTPAIPRGPRQPWDTVDEIVAILKTAFPLLALTMETMVDQFATRFKATHEEELVRYFNALLMEALQQYGLRVPLPNDDGSIPPACLNNATRFADSALSGPMKTQFILDVIEPRPPLREYIRKLQRWRDKYEKVLEARPRLQPLDVLSHWLVEFQHSKFDEVEVPGQYLQHKDTSHHFVRIARFSSQYELCPGQGYCYRRITIHGHDGTKHSFAIQLPASRNCRREEKMHQLFRIFSSVLIRRKESRKRILSFHLPAAVPLSPSLRLLENDSSVVGLQDIYDQHLRELSISKEDPVIMHAEKFRQILESNKPVGTLPNKHHFMNLRLELFEIVSAKMVPNNLVTNYFVRTMANANALWLLRKQFATQMAAVIFQSYIMHCITRTPARFHISRSTGLIYMSDFVPGFQIQSPVPTLGSNEAVPFRFTPNLQTFITPIGVEGVMTAGIMAIGRSLTDPEFELDQYLSLFVRDEVINWHIMHGKPGNNEQNIRTFVGSIVDQIVRRAETMACRMERDQSMNGTTQSGQMTAVQSIVSLLSTASNPQLLSRMSEQWLPWL